MDLNGCKWVMRVWFMIGFTSLGVSSAHEKGSNHLHQPTVKAFKCHEFWRAVITAFPIPRLKEKSRVQCVCRDEN